MSEFPEEFEQSIGCFDNSSKDELYKRLAAWHPSSSGARHHTRRPFVIETIAILLIVLWLLGMVSGYTLGGFIWIALITAVMLFLVRLVSGNKDIRY